MSKKTTSHPGITLLALLMLTVLSASAQTTAWETVRLTGGSASYSGGIIRSWTPTKAVVCYNDGTQDRFGIIDGANIPNMTQALVPAGYTIDDFRIVADEVYCCGRKSSDGFIGHFSLVDLESMVSPLSFEEILIAHSTVAPSATPPCISTTDYATVHRLVAYKNPHSGGITVAAIGYAHNVVPYGVGTRTFATSYIVAADHTPGIFTAEYAPCDYGSNLCDLGCEIESLTDIVETPDYVAFVGSVYQASEECIRRADKYDIMGSITSLPIYYKYLVSGAEPLSEVRATKLDGNRIATASLCMPTAEDFHTSLRVYDLENMNMINAQIVRLPEKMEPSDMVYKEGSDTLLLLQQLSDRTSGQVSKVLYLSPGRTTTYTANAVGAPTGIYTRIDLHNNDYFLLSGGDHWVMHQIGALSVSNTCMSMARFLVKPLEIRPYRRNFPLCFPLTSSPLWNTMMVIPSSYYTDCLHLR